MTRLLLQKLQLNSWDVGLWWKKEKPVGVLVAVCIHRMFKKLQLLTLKRILSLMKSLLRKCYCLVELVALTVQREQCAPLIWNAHNLLPGFYHLETERITRPTGLFLASYCPDKIMNNHWRAEAGMNASIAIVTQLHFDEKNSYGHFHCNNKQKESIQLFLFICFVCCFYYKAKRSANLFFLAF